MTYALALSLHVLAAVIWVGGMFFAYVCLRPALGETLEAPQPARVMHASLRRFFRWVWATVVVLPASGLVMTVDRFELTAPPAWLALMMVLGTVMIALFLHLWFAPYRRLGAALAVGAAPLAAAAIGQIRLIVAINLTLGLVLVVIAKAGPYF